MKWLYTSLLSLTALFCSVEGAGQATVNFYIIGLRPMDALKDSGYSKPLGFSFEFVSPDLLKKRLSFFELRLGGGIEAFFSRYSSPVKGLVFDTPNNDLGSAKFNHQIVSLYMGPKFVFKVNKVKPYFDIFAATRTFSNYQEYTFDNEVPGYEKSTTEDIMWYRRPHYGASVGLMYTLGKYVDFDLRTSYSRGGDIKFIDLKSPERDPVIDNTVKYKVVHSPVSNVLVFRVGLIFKFVTNQNYSQTNYTPPTPREDLTPPPAAPAPKKKPADLKPMPKQPKPVEN